MAGMKRLTSTQRVSILKCLVEGNSIRATSRMTGVSKDTVVKLLVDVGQVCADYMDSAIRNVKCQRVQADEIWAFVGMKQKNVPAERKGEFGVGDVWTWTAMDADSKLVLSFMVGPRDAGTATEFMNDVADHVANRVQLTTDGHRVYLDAVADAFGPAVDYAMLVKHYGSDGGLPEGKYSPGECTGAEKRPITGRPDMQHVSTSYVERQNLTMRMSMRRFTRLTNAFSNKVENLWAAVALHYMYYNFCRRHQTLRVTPAMAAGISDHLWSVEEVVGLLEVEEAKVPNKGGRPRKVQPEN